MKSALTSWSGAALGLAIAGVAGAAADASTIVRFEMNVGNIDVRLYDDVTPISVTNFLNYVTSGRYEDTFVHRVARDPFTGNTADFVVQGGGFLLNGSIFNASGIVTDPPIGDEPGLTNTRGTVAFAKNSSGATSQWFFNLGDNSGLDADDFTVFGHVINGTMSVVDQINNLPLIAITDSEDNVVPPFGEIPVIDFDAVVAKQDITPDEAVMVNAVSVLNFADGDYDFDGNVDRDDLNVWVAQQGSSLVIDDGPTAVTFAESDGNGDGVVDNDDFTIWRNAAGVVEGDYSGDGFVSQADLDLVLLNWGDNVLPTGFDQAGLQSYNFDGLISQNELDGVLLNWGNGTSPNIAAIPEPASLMLLGLGSVATLVRRRR